VEVETYIPCDICKRPKVATYDGAPPEACARLTNPLCGEGDWKQFIPNRDLQKVQCKKCGSTKIEIAKTFEIVRVWELHNNKPTKFSDYEEADVGDEVGPTVLAQCKTCRNCWEINDSIYTLVEIDDAS
jgi:hypothetical protein